MFHSKTKVKTILRLDIHVRWQRRWQSSVDANFEREVPSHGSGMFLNSLRSIRTNTHLNSAYDNQLCVLKFQCELIPITTSGFGLGKC